MIFFLLQKNKQKTCFSTTPYVDCMFLSGPCNNIIDLLDTGDHKNIGRDMIAGQIIFFLLAFLFRFDLRILEMRAQSNTDQHTTLVKAWMRAKNAECKNFPFPE